MVNNVIAFLRKPRGGAGSLLVVCNLTPVPQQGYMLGVPAPGHWQEIFNSDATDYGGSGWGNLGGVMAVNQPSHGRPWSVPLTLPPLAAVVLKGEAHAAQGQH